MGNYAKAAKSPTLIMAGQYSIANIGKNPQARQPFIQDTLPINAMDSLVFISDSIAADRYNKNKSNMTILAAWAGVNIIQGSISATNATGSGVHFFRMNAYWNIINLGIASWGLIQLRKELTQKYTYTQNQLAQQKLEKILLVNTGLDLAYIATGFLLKENGNRLSKIKTT